MGGRKKKKKREKEKEGKYLGPCAFYGGEAPEKKGEKRGGAFRERERLTYLYNSRTPWGGGEKKKDLEKKKKKESLITARSRRRGGGKKGGGREIGFTFLHERHKYPKKEKRKEKRASEGGEKGWKRTKDKVYPAMLAKKKKKKKKAPRGKKRGSTSILQRSWQAEGKKEKRGPGKRGRKSAPKLFCRGAFPAERETHRKGEEKGEGKPRREKKKEEGEHLPRFSVPSFTKKLKRERGRKTMEGGSSATLTSCPKGGKLSWERKRGGD